MFISNVSQPVVGRATNNMAEIQAVTVAAKQARKAGIKKLKISTDSQFLINCVTMWMSKWKRNGWKTAKGEPVINKTELIEMEQALAPLDVIYVWIIVFYLDLSFFQFICIIMRLTYISESCERSSRNIWK